MYTALAGQPGLMVGRPLRTRVGASRRISPRRVEYGPIPANGPLAQTSKYQSLGLYNWSISHNWGSHEWRLALAAGPPARGALRHSRKLHGAGHVVAVVVPQRSDYGRYEGLLISGGSFPAQAFRLDDEARKAGPVLADSTAPAGGRDRRRGKRPGRSAAGG